MSFKEWFDNGLTCYDGDLSGLYVAVYFFLVLPVLFSPLGYIRAVIEHRDGPCDPHDCLWSDNWSGNWF